MDHDARMGKLEAARREMEYAMVLMAHLKSNAACRVKEHEFIAYIEASMISYEKRMEGQEVRTKVLDERVDNVVSAIENLIARIPPSILTQ